MLPKRIKPKHADAVARTVVESVQYAIDNPNEYRVRKPLSGDGKAKAPCEIKRFTRREPEFYTLIGPYLANRNVHKELGGVPWDDPGKRWYIAVDLNTGELLGFSAVMVEKATITFCSSWVRPEKRCGGVYAALLNARLADFGKAAVRARCTALSKAALESRGFVVEKEVGQYFEMKRLPK